MYIAVMFLFGFNEFVWVCGGGCVRVPSSRKNGGNMSSVPKSTPMCIGMRYCNNHGVASHKSKLRNINREAYTLSGRVLDSLVTVIWLPPENSKSTSLWFLCGFTISTKNLLICRFSPTHENSIFYGEVSIYLFIMQLWSVAYSTIWPAFVSFRWTDFLSFVFGYKMLQRS